MGKCDPYLPPRRPDLELAKSVLLLYKYKVHRGPEDNRKHEIVDPVFYHSHGYLRT